jgi:hypothetical protein
MADNNMMIRPCGSSFSYCDGNCNSCIANNTYTTNSTDSLGKPTDKEYADSKESMSQLSNYIRMSRKRQESLIDDLCKEREMQKNYESLYEQHKNIVRKYEIYVDIENNSK